MSEAPRPSLIRSLVATIESRDQRILELEHQYAEYDAAARRVIGEQNAIIECRDQRIKELEEELKGCLPALSRKKDS